MKNIAMVLFFLCCIGLFSCGFMAGHLVGKRSADRWYAMHQKFYEEKESTILRGWYIEGDCHFVAPPKSKIYSEYNDYSGVTQNKSCTLKALIPQKEQP